MNHDLDARWVAALRATQPDDCDLDAARRSINARLEAPATRTARPRRPRRRIGVSVAALVAIAASVFGTTQLVTARDDKPAPTADGTELGQVFIVPTDSAHVWTVEVEQSRTGEACLKASQGAGAGAICARNWSFSNDQAMAIFTPLKESATSQHHLIVVVASPANRTVLVTPSEDLALHLPADQLPSTELADLEGVHTETVQIKGVAVTVSALVINGQLTDDPKPPPLFFHLGD